MGKIASTENMELLLDCIFHVKLFLYNGTLCALYNCTFNIKFERFYVCVFPWSHAAAREQLNGIPFLEI
jgi:hypothetical protein